MRRWRSLNYIDGFAGPGIYKGGEVGSPIIALETLIEHTLSIPSKTFFGFIELDCDRADCLREVLAERFNDLPSNIAYEVYCASFEETMKDIFEYIEDKGTKLAPTFAFLDPFGYSGMPLEVTERLLENPHCEVLITFMEGFINRFAEIEDSRSEELDELFGTEDWRLVRKLKEPDERREFLLKLYQNQLRNLCNAECVRSFEMINQHNQPVYYLTFATKHWKGMKVMKEAMSRVDPTMNYRYSDLTNPKQSLLLDYADEAFWCPKAKESVAKHFAGKAVGIEEIEKYVVTETPFVLRKRSILRPLEECKPPIIEKVEGRSRRFTYPDGCIIHFAR